MDGIKIGSKLLQLRKKAGLSQGELADRLGVSRQAISKWECDESLPDTENLIMIAKLFAISLDELVDNVPAAQEACAQSNETNGPAKALCGGDDGEENDEEEDDGEDDDEDSFDDATTEKQKRLLRVLYSIPGPILLTAVFLLWGFLFGGWSVAWTVFLLVPVFDSVLACFRTRRVSPFAFSVFITFVYCLIGMQWGLWHPCWILFFSVPVFYHIAEAIDGNNKRKNANAAKETAEESHEDSEDTGKTEE